MIDAASFRMIELLTRDDLEAHPVWADFHDERDRARILSWGVTPERLDAEIERYDYCGRAPLYPVVDLAAVRDVASPSIALRVLLPDGSVLPGYRLGANAFGIYVGDEEYCLNPSLPSRAREVVERLAAILGMEAASFGALRYESVVDPGDRGSLGVVLGRGE